MWTRHSRVIWLCLTKQHSQTQKFLLGLFSHHSSKTGGGGDSGRRTGRQNKRERDQGWWERKHFFGMRQNTITRETYYSKTEKKSNLWKERRKQRSPGAKSSWSLQKCPLRGVQWSLRDLKCHDLIGCQPEIEAPDWLWHIPQSNPVRLTFPLMSPHQIIHGC